MIARHTLTYVGSRAVAAALNMASLAVFTRLAPVDTFGTYLFILSWAIVLYGATCQWPKFAFFALYDDARAPEQIGTLVRILVGLLALTTLATAAAAGLGFVEARFAAAVIAATAGTTIFEGTLEIARTRLAAETVAVSVVSRGALVLGLGSMALSYEGDARDLVLAVGLANALAAIPAGLSVWPLVRHGKGSVTEARRLLAYGWPLVLSFGIAALAQTIDRLIIGKTVGTEDLGAYGAIGDFLRQSFVVFGESIALSMISIAKRDARDGGMESAAPVLRDAARALTLIGAFGAVFFLTFDETIVSILLGPAYRDSAMTVAPFLIAASVCMMFRAYYFGQVIYFTGSSTLDAIASTILLVATGGLSLALIPLHGVRGAAIALATGQALACLVYIFGANGRIRMPVPILDILLITTCALAASVANSGIDLMFGTKGPALLALKVMVIALFAVGAVWHFNIIGLAEGITRRVRRAP
ncbi:oligosaccharide flippase family protein [Methylobacterium sp. WL9]|uniref:lipopolysaccharide biosynthesis protein n=1 Tax=Methylobacterium sp. WL9 TaxID=2603898 RepID=UPI0011C72786|nr:oligosaccharide flippase family protein [Methylobacterium sp. WL9]TXN20753.1 oligosaccharide flippase family protein [Methylobacterium sp. WL9]